MLIESIWILISTAWMLALWGLAQRLLDSGHRLKVDLNSNNPARSLAQAGSLLAVFWMSAALVEHCRVGDTVQYDLARVGLFGLVSMVLFEFACFLGWKVLLERRLHAELDAGNVAAGLPAGAHALATGLLVGHTVIGTELLDLVPAILFFFLGQTAWALLLALYRLATVYDESAAIQSRNLAAGVSYAGATLAVALVVARATEGEFLGWSASLMGFGRALLDGVLLWPARQLLVGGLFLAHRPALRGGALDQAIAKGHVGPAAVEAATAVGLAWLLHAVG